MLYALGIVDTPIYDKIWTEEEIKSQMMAQYIPAVPTKVMIKPEEIAELAYFLCGDAAKNATGGTYVLDGGFIAQ